MSKNDKEKRAERDRSANANSDKTMIHPIPVPICAVHQRMTGVTDIAAGFGSNSCNVYRRYSMFNLATAQTWLFRPNTLPAGTIVIGADNEAEIRFKATRFPPTPSPAPSGTWHWLSIILSVYALSSVLSCILLALILKHDKRTFSTGP